MSGTASPASFATPMSVCVQRRNPVRIPRRDILVQASDTPTLSLTIYQQDTDTAPLDVSAATFLLNIYRERDMHRGCDWWDYGFDWWFGQPYVVAAFPAVPINPQIGRVDIALAANPAECVVGRFAFELTMSFFTSATTGIGVVVGSPEAAGVYAQGNYTVLRGVIDFPPGASVPLVQSVGLLSGIGIPTS